MTTDSQKRWLEEGAGPGVRELLESAALDEPTPAQLESLTRRLAPQLEEPHGSGGPTGGGGAGLAGKVGALVVVAGIATAAFLMGRQSSPPPEPTTPPRPAVTAPPVEAPAPGPPSVTAPPVETPAPAQPSGVAPVVAPPTPTKAPSPVGAVARPATPSAADEDADYELLQRALQSPSAEEKLQLAEEHGARFPGSSLAQEREVLAIDALVKLGRSAEAKARLERFARQWPTSAHLVRLEHLLAP
ncbi:MAG: hypothetical protein IAE78_00110 [Myxococcus sp.]|nr:hypothetical protein [Myxococcus sp.]